VKTPTSTAVRAPTSRTSIVRNAPSSGEICMPAAPPVATRVSSARSRSRSSEAVQWASRYSSRAGFTMSISDTLPYRAAFSGDSVPDVVVAERVVVPAERAATGLSGQRTIGGAGLSGEN